MTEEKDMGGSPSVEIIFPKGTFGSVSDEPLLDTCMRVIGVGFGDTGDWNAKYGCTVETDVFMMHRFCWCESEDCLWCGGCGCPNPAPTFLVDGREVTSDEYWAASRAIVAPMPHDIAEYGTKKYKTAQMAFDASIAERNRRLTTIYAERVHHCEPSGLMANRARGPSYCPTQTAPNFWFKPTNSRLWWYKYIGRDTEADGELPSDFMQQVFTSHPTGMTLDEAIAETARQESETAESFAKMFSKLGTDNA